MRFIDRLRTEKLLSFTLIVFTLAIGVVIGTLISTGVNAARPNAGNYAPDATPLTIPNQVELPSQFTSIAKQVEPSVVNISTTYLPKVTLVPLIRLRLAAPVGGLGDFRQVSGRDVDHRGLDLLGDGGELGGQLNL
ncbi:MAG: hypothetical protein WAJ87_02115, partial [Bryobacteraceae bacterium]